MSDENAGAKSSLGSYLVFPAATTGFGALTAVKRAHWNPAKAAKNLEVENFKKLGVKLKEAGYDSYSKSMKLAQNYEELKTLQKQAYKTSKVSLWNRFTNLFKSDANKVTAESMEKAHKEALKKLDDATASLKNGKEIIETSVQTTSDAAESVAKTAAKTAKGAADAGFKSTAKGLLKKELTSKFNLVMSVATTFVPAFVEKVVPAFKNEGIGAGLKQFGKALIQTGSDFVGYAAGGAIGRTIGTLVGTIICPGAGSALGGTLGDMFGSMIVGGNFNKAVDKIIKADDGAEKVQNNQTQLPSDATGVQNGQIPQTVQQSAPVQYSEPQQPKVQKDYSNIPSFEEARRMANITSKNRNYASPVIKRTTNPKDSQGFYKESAQKTLVTENNKRQKLNRLM